LRTEPYLDTDGIATIGVGHTGSEVQMGLVWTVERCREVPGVLSSILKWRMGCPPHYGKKTHVC